jgi:hypothetical protein
MGERIDKFKEHIKAEIMQDRIDKIKQHFIDHKIAYFCISTGIATAGFTYVIMRGHHANLHSRLDEGLKLNKPIVGSLNFFSRGNDVTSNIVTVIEREGRGHPGYIVRSLDTNDIFPSQQSAANCFGIPESVLSDHLRGKFPNANGFLFERILFPQGD